MFRLVSKSLKLINATFKKNVVESKISAFVEKVDKSLCLFFEHIFCSDFRYESNGIFVLG